MLTALRDLLRELSEDEAVRVVVLTGAGERAFAAGADIKEMQEKSVAEIFTPGAPTSEIVEFLREKVAA